MADERRKGPSDRRRSRATKGPQDAEQPASQPKDQGRGGNPNGDAAFAADELDESLRARQQEGFGEVF